MLVTADEKMVPELKKLWKICFGDSDEYIDNFFKKAYAPERTLVSVIDNAVAGAAYLFPCKIGGKRGSYLYAGGVFPEFRRRGLYEEMMHEWSQWCQKRGIIPFLKPADDRLWDYYERIGFSEFIGGRRVVIENGGDSVCRIEKTGAAEFIKMRDASQIQWEHMEYILSENRLCGGECVRIVSEKGECAIVYAVVNSTLYVRGLAGNVDVIYDCAADLMTKIPSSKISIIIDSSADCGEYIRLTAAVGADKVYVGAADLLMD